MAAAASGIGRISLDVGESALSSLDVFLWEEPPKALRSPPVMTVKLKFI